MRIGERLRRPAALGAMVLLIMGSGAACGDDSGPGEVTAPDAPTNVAVDVDGTTAVVTWTPGARATSQTVTVSDVAEVEADRERSFPNGSAASATFTNLTPGGEYTALVTASNSAGTPTSDPPAAFSIQPLPAAVTVAAVTSADTVALSWALSATATFYRAELSGGTNPLAPKVLDAAATEARFTDADDGLEDGVTYTATVYAINEIGETASNQPEVTTNFFPWDEFLPTSLHATGEGKRTWYNADQNGFEQFTQVDYETLDCKSCHAPITNNDCTACHTEADPQLGADVDATLTGACGNCHGRQKAEAMPDGYTDHHRDVLGFDCMACHSLGDVHGDGNVYASQLDDGAIDANCANAGCHESVAANTYHDMHGANIDCSTCHIQSVVTCVNCHFEGEVLGDPPVKVAYGQFKDWMFMMNFRGKVHAANFQSLKWGGDANPDVAERYTFVAMAPFYAHTIDRNAVTACADCHGNAAVADYGDDGVMHITTWNADTNRLEQTLSGRIPVPPDYATAMRMDFVDQPTTDPVDNDPDQWVFFETGPDAIQIIYGSPLTAEQMTALE